MLRKFNPRKKPVAHALRAWKRARLNLAKAEAIQQHKAIEGAIGRGKQPCAASQAARDK